MEKEKSKINSDSSKDWLNCIQAISIEGDTDIYIISGGLYEPADESLIERVESSKSKSKALLLLTTFGGDADVAYRIARCFQRSYKSFSIFVCDICKSAGTLVTLGADELIMSECAHLGPLDVQIGKTDELGKFISGLDPVHALNFLKDHTFSFFEQYLLTLVRKSGSQITTKTSADIATKLTDGLFQPIYSQLDPLKLGEYHRNMLVAIAYGERLTRDNRSNLRSLETLERLVYQYPSHTFVIDRKEAEELFMKVRQPTPDEVMMVGFLKTMITTDKKTRPIARISYINPNIDSEEKKQPETEGIQ